MDGSNGERIDYRDVAAAIAATGMVTRGGFITDADDQLEMPDRSVVRSVVVIGNIGGAMWPMFRAGQAHQPATDPNPLDTWTRSVLSPIADAFGAAFVHPSDEPFQPFQRWAQRADDVWQSPIGLLIHAQYGLWHAYRGAFLFARPIEGLPSTGPASNGRTGATLPPCSSCVGQPCLHTCPVGAFTADGYDSAACATHVRSDEQPDCLHEGCAARLACPVGADLAYGADQMEFHMRAFVGGPA